MKVELTECPNCKNKTCSREVTGQYFCNKCGTVFESHEIKDAFYEEEKPKKWKLIKPWWWGRNL